MIDEALEARLELDPEFDDDPVGRAGIRGQRAVARAAAGRRKEALSMVRRTLAASRREPRAYLTILVAARVVSADRILGLLRRAGRGVQTAGSLKRQRCETRTQSSWEVSVVFAWRMPVVAQPHGGAPPWAPRPRQHGTP